MPPGCARAAPHRPDYTLHFTTPNLHGWAQNTPSVPRGRQWLRDWLKELKLTQAPLVWSIVDVRIYGPLGVTVSHYRWAGVFKGTPFDVEGFVTDVWIRRGGRWIMLASAVDMVPAGTQ